MINRILAPAVAALLAAIVIYGLVPPPHHARAQFADQGAWARSATSVTTSGATTVTLALDNVASLTDIVGVNISFNPPANSVGPVSIVVTGASGTTTATALQRPSSLGLVALSLNELWAGETTSVQYNGSVFVLSRNVDMTPIGHPVEFRGSAAPRGALIEDGSCVSQSQFAALFAVIGTSYNALAPTACTGSTFALPDSRGTGFVAFDGQGANGLANRITTASCPTPNAIGLCGSQTQTLTVAQIPVVTASGAALGVSVSVSGSISGSAAMDAFSANPTGSAIAYSPSAAAFGPLAVTGTFSGSGSGGTTSGPVVSCTNCGGAAHPILNPELPGIRAIKY